MPGKKESSVFHRVIHVDSVEEADLNGHDAVQVIDVVGNEFTTFRPEAKKMLLNQKDELEDEVVEIGFTVYKGQYLSFHSIGSPSIEYDEDPLDQRLDPEALVEKELTETDRRITRQSAVHDASRIVQGMISAGKIQKGRGGMDEFREEVQDELEHWTEKFKNHHRTGEWGGEE